MDMSRTPQEREQIRERFAAGRDEEISDAEKAADEQRFRADLP